MVPRITWLSRALSTDILVWEFSVVLNTEQLPRVWNSTRDSEARFQIPLHTLQVGLLGAKETGRLSQQSGYAVETIAGVLVSCSRWTKYGDASQFMCELDSVIG